MIEQFADQTKYLFELGWNSSNILRLLPKELSLNMSYWRNSQNVKVHAEYDVWVWGSMVWRWELFAQTSMILTAKKKLKEVSYGCGCGTCCCRNLPLRLMNTAAFFLRDEQQDEDTPVKTGLPARGLLPHIQVLEAHCNQNEWVSLNTFPWKCWWIEKYCMAYFRRTLHAGGDVSAMNDGQVSLGNVAGWFWCQSSSWICWCISDSELHILCCWWLQWPE